LSSDRKLLNSRRGRFRRGQDIELVAESVVVGIVDRIELIFRWDMCQRAAEEFERTATPEEMAEAREDCGTLAADVT
jgi:hypothetical protein